MSKSQSRGSAGRKPASKRPPRNADKKELVIGPATELTPVPAPPGGSAEADALDTAVGLLRLIPPDDVRALLPVLKEHVVLTPEHTPTKYPFYTLAQVAELVDTFDDCKLAGKYSSDVEQFSCADLATFIHNNGKSEEIIEAMFLIAPAARRLCDRLRRKGNRGKA